MKATTHLGLENTEIQDSVPIGCVVEVVLLNEFTIHKEIKAVDSAVTRPPDQARLDLII